MAATETSILVLGAVMLFEPVNGYQVRRELLTWQVEGSGQIQPGSIYSMLTTQTKRGHLVRHDLPEAGRSVAVYESTAAGRAEFERLVAEAIETVDVLNPLPYHTALTFMGLGDREWYAARLRARATALERVVGEYDEALTNTAAGSAPPHAVALVEMQREFLLVDQRTLAALLARVEAGEFSFRGESMDWVPAEDDPGWQMDTDRERYREAIRQNG